VGCRKQQVCRETVSWFTWALASAGALFGYITFAMSTENNRLETHVVQSTGRTRRMLTTIIGISVIGMLGLIALVWLSDFPGPTQGSSDKSEAPPEDVRRAD
jgi:hypothetical protein